MTAELLWDSEVANSKWWSLLVKPDVFFWKYVKKIPSWVFYLVNVILSFGFAIEQIDKKISRGEFIHFAADWSVYWYGVLIGGIVCLLYVYIAVVWYGFRIKFSKGERKFKQSHTLYAYSSLLWAIPVILIAIIETAVYSSASAITALGWIYTTTFVIVSSCIYSIYVSYIWVKTLHPEASPGRLKLWFLILPTLVYTIGLAVLTVIIFTS